MPRAPRLAAPRGAHLESAVAGILPASGGHLSVLLQRGFWKQSFVVFAIAAELCLGFHDLMLSGCSYSRCGSAAREEGCGGRARRAARAAPLTRAGRARSPERRQQQQAQQQQDAALTGGALEPGEPGPAESFEFFVWSRRALLPSSPPPAPPAPPARRREALRPCPRAVARSS